MKETLKNYRENVDKKLIIRQRIFFIIIFILLTISALNLIHGKIGLLLGISGFIVSTLFGLLISRMFTIFWHEEKEKVVSKLDTIGIIILIFYIGMEVGRNWIFGHWLSGATLSSFSLIVLTGLILGRFLGTLIKIHNVLRTELTS